MAPLCPHCSGALEDGVCLPCLLRVSLSDTSSEPAPALRELRPGDRIGDYTLLEPLGRGGMGVVFLARQTRLDRLVAIKTLLADRTFLPENIARFRREAEALAGLRHPNIVGVHEMVEAEGRQFLVMEHVAGLTLAEQARRHPYSMEEAARCVYKLAQAVEYAHQRGILHRDLKPSNILLDEQGEPRITDFGLAKRLASDSRETNDDPSVRANPSFDVTFTGQMLGSPHFMSPEQISARHGRTGPASDIYALGAILYQLLTGQPPFSGATVEETLLKVTGANAIPPRQLNTSVAPDLETICLKCLEKEPGRRYASAQRLAEDLGRFLRGEPTLARPLGPTARVGRWARRNPALASLSAVAFAGLAAFAISLLWAERRVAERERVVRRNAYVADIHLAQKAIEANNPSHAREILDRWLPDMPSASGRRNERDLRGFEWFHLRHVCVGDDATLLGTEGGSILSMAFSPDGLWLASGSVEGEVKLWDVVNRRNAASIRHKGRVDALKFTADSRILASGSIDKTVRLSAVPSLKEVRPHLSAKNWVLAVGFNTDASELAAVTFDSSMGWDLKSGAENYRHSIPGWVRSAFAPDLRLVALAKSSGQILVWDSRRGSERTNWMAHQGMTLPVTFSPDGRWIASGGFDAKAKIWEVETTRLLKEIDAHHATVAAIAFSPDGKLFATASYDQTARVWDTGHWMQRASFRGQQSSLWAVAFSPDSQTVALGAKDGSVLLWPLGSENRPPDALSFEGTLHGFTPDYISAHFRDSDGQCHQLDLVPPFANRPIPPPPGTTGPFLASVGGRLALVPDQGHTRLWTGERFEELAVQGKPVAIIGNTESPDHAFEVIMLDVGENLTAVSLLDLKQKRMYAHLEERVRGTVRAAFSSDQQWLAITTQEGEIILWDVAAKQTRAKWRAHKLAANGAFSPDGRILATSGEEGVVRLWDIASRRILAEFRAGVDAFWSVAISPDGRRLCAGTGDGAVVVWDVESQQHLVTLRGHKSAIVSNVRFCPDGTLLSVSDRDICFWRCQPKIPSHAGAAHAKGL